MAEALNRTPDFPTFDTYPMPAADPTLPRQRNVTSERGIEVLNDAAASIGNAVGLAVSRIRDLQHELERAFNVARERASTAAAEKTEELRAAAEAKTAQIRNAAGEQIERARARAEYVSREYPFQIIAGVAATAFVAGIALRVWRSNRG